MARGGGGIGRVVDAERPDPPSREHAVELRSGRRLGVAEFGDPAGIPILWFHGTPGARRQIPPAARRAAGERGLRLLGVERPGIGWSTPHLYDSVLDWAGDVEELADLLELERFGAIALSGGGPYVLACAHHLPERLVAGAIFGGVAPSAGPDAAAGGLISWARSLGGVLRPLREPLGLALSGGIRALHPMADRVFDLYVRFGPQPDRVVLERPDMRAMFVDDLLNGTRENLRAILYDLVLFGRPWGFSLRELRVPIHFWQGDADSYVPFSHGAHLAALVPGAKLTLRTGDGHLACLDASDEAFDFILTHWKRQQRRKTTTRRKRTAARRSRA